MKTVTVLKLQDLYKLDAELNGLINPETNELLVKGLLSEEIPFTTKFWLTKLAELVSKERQSINRSREDLIRKYGQEDNQGNIIIPMYINEVVDETTKEVTSRETNPAYLSFQDEFNSLLFEDYELEHNVFNLEDFKNIKSETNYQVFYKLIKVDE